MKKMMLNCFLALSLAVTSTAFAKDTHWEPAATAPDSAYWAVAENWRAGEGLPVEGDKVIFNVLNAAECILDSTVSIGHLVMGDGGDVNQNNVLRVVDGGSLTTTNSWFGIGYSTPATLIVEEGGMVEASSHLWFGTTNSANCKSTVIINGGTVIGRESFRVGNGATIGNLSLNAGVLDVERTEGTPIQPGSLMDIRLGTFITHREEDVAKFESMYNQGRLTAFGGDGELSIVYENGMTVITATSPMMPSPSYNGTVAVGDVNLKWTNVIDPNDPADPLFVDVWFGTEPNEVATSNWAKLVSGMETDKGISDSVPITATNTDIYYWRVDTYIMGSATGEPIVGDLFKFNTTNDFAPTVEVITPNTLTWAGEPVQLDAQITDLGNDHSTVYVEWSVSEEFAANVTFSPSANAEDPVIVGDMHLPNTTVTCTVWDEFNGEAASSSDTVIIDIAEDACQGARGGFQRLDLVYAADYDGNCIIDLYDFAMIAGQWLDIYELGMPLEIPRADSGDQTEGPAIE